MIKMYHVNMSYRKGVNTLEDITLNIKKGEFALLTGPSGAGKTTLLKLLTCQERPDDGQIVVNGRNIARIKQSQLYRHRRDTGIVFQDSKLLKDQTVLDNVAMPLEIRGKSRKEARHKAWNLLRDVGLHKKAGSYPLQVSGGEQQRVAIARALVGRPSILLADEPTGNLDSENSEYILNLLEAANKADTTILVATHDETLIRKHSCRLLTLKEGRMVSDKRPLAPIISGDDVG
ncbi:MAG: cell division ATP-binding protein FtsE [bacterium]|nr:cell division ATP-binding protein FtsE [bacterium]